MKSIDDLIRDAAIENASSSPEEQEAFIKGAMFALKLHPRRVITDPAELDMLGSFSVAIDKDADAWQKTDQDDGWWVQIGVPPSWTKPELLSLKDFLPAVVLLDIPAGTLREGVKSLNGIS